MNAHFVLDVIQLLPIVLIGYTLPWMGRSRRGLLFGVTVPLDFTDSVAARLSVRRYRNGALIVATLTTISCVAGVMLQSGEWIGVRIAPFAVVLELVAFMALWQRERHAIRPYAIVVPLERTATLTSNHSLGGVVATASSALPLIATALWLHYQWALIPERWPRHWNAVGVADNFGAHTVSSVYTPCVLGLLLVLLFTGMTAFLGRAAGLGATQRALTLAPLAGMTWLAVGASCWTALLPLQTDLTPHFIAVSAVLYGLGLFAAVGWLLYRLRDINSPRAVETYDGTPDAHWYGGVIYYNPGDAAVLVPKRYGWGWTLNFARPAAWVFTAAIVGFAVCSALLPKLLR